MTEEQNSYYQIYIQGYLGKNWSEWLHAFQIQYKDNGVTVLTGPVMDQAALRGLLDRLFDLGISILFLRQLGFHPEGKVIFPL